MLWSAEPQDGGNPGPAATWSRAPPLHRLRAVTQQGCVRRIWAEWAGGAWGAPEGSRRRSLVPASLLIWGGPPETLTGLRPPVPCPRVRAARRSGGGGRYVVGVPRRRGLVVACGLNSFCLKERAGSVLYLTPHTAYFQKEIISNSKALHGGRIFHLGFVDELFWRELLPSLTSLVRARTGTIRGGRETASMGTAGGTLGLGTSSVLPRPWVGPACVIVSPGSAGAGAGAPSLHVQRPPLLSHIRLWLSRFPHCASNRALPLSSVTLSEEMLLVTPRPPQAPGPSTPIREPHSGLIAST